MDNRELELILSDEDEEEQGKRKTRKTNNKHLFPDLAKTENQYHCYFFGLSLSLSLSSSEVRLTALLLAALIIGCRLGGRLVVSPLISEHAGGRSSQGGAVRAQRGGGRDGE